MKLFKLLLITLVLGTVSLQSNIAEAASKGKILVVLSSDDSMTLADGSTIKTGFYLNELGVPAMEIQQAGYDLVLATPAGNKPVVDKRSVSKDYFQGDEARLQRVQNFVQTLIEQQQVLSLEEVLKAGLDSYKGLFIPGGHAPIIDLASNHNLGEILYHFNRHRKPTAAICHGPIALLAAQINPQGFVQSVENDEPRTATGWVYEDYQMTIFSSAEEEVFESSLDGRKLTYYPADAMEAAGAAMEYAENWKPKVVVDRELVTGQNPFSDQLLAEAFIELLKSK